MVDEARVLAGVIGHPLEHSLSPAMHNAAFEALGLPWSYAALPVPPGQLGPELRGFVARGFRAFNVTIPHKEGVISLLDEISGDAERIAAVNTISVRDGLLFGENTDWQGFLSDLDQIGFRPHGSNALILGSGGAARAVVYALVARGCSVTVAGRNPLTVKAIIDHMQRCFARSSVDGMDPGRLTELKRPFDLVVNTTPVGMYPKVHDTPWPESLPFPRCSLAYDLVYNPSITSFMRQAEREGIKAVNGLGMLVQQAAAAFTIWTGREAPLQIMRNAALRGLRC